MNKVKMQMSTYLTVREVADVLRTSPGAIYKMVERGQLPGVIRLGTRLRFDGPSLVHWVDQNRAPSLSGGQG